jgi:hypothetical protein
MSFTIFRATVVASLAVALSPTFADTIVEGRITSWGHSCQTNDPASDCVRGVAFDGRHWYVADFRHGVFIYDDKGNQIKHFPVNFAHGVATDGARLWSSDYFFGHIFEYDISTGALLKTLNPPQPDPRKAGTLSLDYNPGDRSLWVTAYNDPIIYQMSAESGAVMSTVVTQGFGGPNKRAMLDGRGDLWVGGATLEHNDELWRYDKQSHLLQQLTGTGYISIGMNINNRERGYVRDLAPTCRHGDCSQHFQFMRALTTGGSTRNLTALTVTCRNVTTGMSSPAHFGGDALWNCEDAGFIANPGDVIHIDVDGSSQ